MINRLTIGSIFVYNNTRLIVVGYNKDNNYIVCICDDKCVLTNKLYLILANQIDKVLCLGYVDNKEDNEMEKFNNSVNATNISSKYLFDQNGFVIGEK